MNASQQGQIEIWFDFASVYSYLSVMRIEKEASKHDVKVLYRPFLLGPIFKSFGWDTSPFLVNKVKGDHMWKDMDRQAKKYGLPWQRPTIFPVNSVLATRVALVGTDQAWMAGYCRAVCHLHFADNRDISDRSVITQALSDLGLDASAVLEAAESPDNKPRLRLQTETAASRGLFGAPSFIARNELFWGNDRLEDTIEFAR